MSQKQSYSQKRSNFKPYSDKQDRGGDRGGDRAGVAGGTNRFREFRGDRSERERAAERRFEEASEQLDKTFSYVSVDDGKMVEDLLNGEDIVTTPDILENEVKEFDDIRMPGLDEEDENNGLKDNLYRGIMSYGFAKPSRIQQLAIQIILNGKEIIAQSQSGTGKSGAFLISGLQLLDETLHKPQVIYLSNTTDLAYQTCSVGKALAQYMDNVKFSLTIGGPPRGENIKMLGGTWQGEKLEESEVAQVVVATPGRLIDMVENFPELFSHIKLMVIDECDEILSSFKEDIKNIIYHIPSEMQICLFSATMTDETVRIAEKMLNKPSKILIRKEKITLKGIKQTYMRIQGGIEEKLNTIIEMLSSCPVQKLIIYANSKRTVEQLEGFLREKDFQVLSITSDMDKASRIKVLSHFKNNPVKCLISTDLLARGIDIQQLSLVVNFDLPRIDNIQAYIHRIGRTGRYGKKGLAINFVSSKLDWNTILRIQALFRCEIKALEMSDITEIGN